MKYVIEEEKHEGRRIFVLYERDGRGPDIAIADSPHKTPLRKYKKKLDRS